MHADVTGKPVVLCENIDAPLLGCAILASVGAGIHNSVEDAVNAMVRVTRRVEPNEPIAAKYDEIYSEAYSKLSSTVRPIVHSLVTLRGGVIMNNNDDEENKEVVVSPSVLAADWSSMGNEIRRCVGAGLNRLHVDIFDGVYIDSPYALTFGPQVK